METNQAIKKKKKERIRTTTKQKTPREYHHFSFDACGLIVSGCSFDE